MTALPQASRPHSDLAHAETPAQAAAQPAPALRTAEGACQRDTSESSCPSCGAEMRLWANYYRCRTCGYKESCCF
jgi:hypothetical protein